MKNKTFQADKQKNIDFELGNIFNFFNGLFTWREGTLANRATWLEGLTHSPPLHATHLTETVSEMSGLSFEWPLSTTNKMAD